MADPDIYDVSTYFQYVDSIAGTPAAGKTKNLVPIVVNRQYHRKVQTKIAFQRLGLIGPDTYSEGNTINTAPGYPVIRKTDLVDNPGDTIRVGILNNLTATINTGKVGNSVMVGSEVALDFNDLQVKVMQLRNAVMTTGGAMDVQRNPYKPLEQIEMDVLSDWYSQVQDTGILYALHSGWAPHLYREHGVTNCPPTQNTNILFGNSLDTTRTIASLDGTGLDDISAKTFELSQVYCEQTYFDPVMVDGVPYWCALISPAAAFTLMQDDRFNEALKMARERAATNPLFRNAEFIYANHIIYKYDKIRSILGKVDPAAHTVTSKAITETAYSGIGGGLSTIHQMIVLGANAVALAEGNLRMAERIRKEDDYQNIIGRAADGIWGAKRADWAAPTSPYTPFNQSSLVIINSLVKNS